MSAPRSAPILNRCRLHWKNACRNLKLGVSNSWKCHSDECWLCSDCVCLQCGISFLLLQTGRSHWSRVGLRIIVSVHNHRSILLIMNFSLSEFCHCYIICRQSLTSLGINDINSVFASFENIRLCHDHFGALIIRLFVIGLTGNPASPGLSGVILGVGLLLSS